MSTTQLQSALAQTHPPNLAFHRTGWVWRNGVATEIRYIVGSDEVGHQFIHEVGTRRELEMTPYDTEKDLRETQALSGRCQGGRGVDFDEFPDMRHAEDECPGPECTCYEIIGGHQTGCYFYGRKETNTESR